MEKPGSPEYLIRRLNHWFRRSWTKTEPVIKLFVDLEDEIRTEILKIALDSKFQVLLYYQSGEHWCLVDLDKVYYKHKEEFYELAMTSIAKLDNTWGRTTIEDQIKVDHKVKQSEWVSITTFEARQYDLLLGTEHGSCIWNCIRRAKQLKIAYNFEDYELNYKEPSA